MNMKHQDIDGWRVFLHKGKYYRLCKSINGKYVKLHHGRNFSMRRAKEQIRSYLKAEGRSWLRKPAPVPVRHSVRHCFFNVSNVMPDAMRHFSEQYSIPIISNHEAIRDYDVVLFSMSSNRDFYRVAEIAEYKGKTEWIAGGSAVTNPTGVMWIMDWIYIGDCFHSFQKILDGERLMPGMLNCRYPHPVEFQDEPIFDRPIYDSRILMSRGCKRRCLFCVNPYRCSYQEQDFRVIERFIAEYPGKGLYLASNSSDDVSYYSDVIELLKQYGKTDLMVSSSIFKMSEDFLREKRSTILIGIEGFSERLRKLTGKSILRDMLLEKLDTAFFYGRQVKTVYQFSLPTETETDFEEFHEDVRYLTQKRNTGSWNFSFIPHQPSPMTPFQWNEPYYSRDMLNRLKDFRQSCFGTKNGNQVQMFAPNILHPLRWFRQIIADWIPITPEVCRVLNRLPESASADECVQAFSSAGIDVSFVFRKKPDDFPFPWDFVKTATPKHKLFPPVSPQFKPHDF